MGGLGQGVAFADQGRAVASAQGEVAITIYNHDLALVQDVRSLPLPAGRSLQEMAEVSAQIRPETVTIAAPGASVLEQNFDYDLLSPERLVDKGVGQDVTIIRTNPATGAETVEKGRILANNGGTLVQIGNRIEVLGDMKARLVFDQLPEGLKARPTLSVALDAAKSGTRPVSLSYLSRGFGWKADYVALFDEVAGKMDVQGWVTLNNTSGTSFNAAKVLLVAGDVGVSGGGDDDDTPQPVFRRGGVVSGEQAMGIEGSTREQLGDFYVYPISGRVQVANQQQKQISFLNVTGAAAHKVYSFRNDWLGAQEEAQSFATSLAFSTGAKEGLGDALPAGTMRIYMRDARGQAQFIGEDSIAHTPQGSLLTVKTGEAFDVKIQPVLEKREKIDAGEWERVARFRVGDKVTTVEAAKTYWRTHMRYNLTNARAQPVEVEVVQAGLDGGAHDTRVSAESVKGEQRNANERVWHVTIPAHGSLALTAQIDTRY
ncbi:DUF4139 domain-containing protein [Novosphingobium umbonatum]|uniref:DUF4139 domain-containing protein n=2 Tax=Novosphingobium umbonatum TaxID=1908524 RepID=A0A3S2VAP8_9SPHN|nr:DUF4139 domain-containing protein [Novosphingobium umbonatum]